MSCFCSQKGQQSTKLDFFFEFFVNILEVLPESARFLNGLLSKTVLFEYSVKNYSNIEYFSKKNIRINIRILSTLNQVHTPKLANLSCVVSQHQKDTSA
jgi:hypothetical protein